MAQKAHDLRKTQLVAELERSRAELARGLGGVREDVSVTSYLKRSLPARKWSWFAGAAVGGLVLTRLLFRGKGTQAIAESQPASRSSKASKSSEPERAGIWLTLFGLLATMLKPTLTRIISQRIADFAAGPGDGAARSSAHNGSHRPGGRPSRPY
jgi:hypothetical protein